MSFIKSVKPKQLASFLLKAEEKRGEQKLWELWLTIYPNMTEETYVSFADFYDSVVTPPTNERTIPAHDFVKETYSYFRKKVGQSSGH